MVLHFMHRWYAFCLLVQLQKGSLTDILHSTFACGTAGVTYSDQDVDGWYRVTVEHNGQQVSVLDELGGGYVQDFTLWRDPDKTT